MIVDTIVRIAKTHEGRTIIAISGSQGSGKTTITKSAEHTLSTVHGIPTKAVSVDDYYRPYAELSQLAAESKNPLLQHRGLPGTHDFHGLNQMLSDFLAGKTGIEIPIYDKSQHDGAGDRVGTSKLPENTQCILLEGWMLGFQPVDEDVLEKRLEYINLAKLSVKVTLQNLIEINDYLKEYVPIWKKCTQFILLKPEDLQFVYKWRLQQEHDMIQSKGSGMSDEAVKAFVDQYMPCYFVYSDTLPESGDTFWIDAEHGVHTKPSSQE